MFQKTVASKHNVRIKFKRKIHYLTIPQCWVWQWITMLTVTIYCISNLFFVSITTTVTMFVKSSSLSVVKPQLSLTFRSLLRVLFSVKNNNNNNCNNVCKKIKSECGDYTFPKPQLSLSALTIRSLNAVASSSPRGRFSCRLQVDDEGLLFSPSWS